MTEESENMRLDNEEGENSRFKVILDWAKNKREKFHWFLYKNFPGLINDPYYDLSRYQKRDEEKNLKTTPSEEEGSDLFCLWAIEFYTPSCVDNLRVGFNRLGWNTKDSIHSNNDLVHWLDSSRSMQAGGSWTHLGVLKNPNDDRNFMPSSRTVVLPPNVDYATSQLFHLTSSITCFVTCFMYKESYSNIFDEALKNKYQTYTKRLKPRGHRILDPESQKKMKIREIRKILCEDASRWYRSNFPGIFSSKSRRIEIPTCELAFLKGDPFSTTEKSRSTYMNLLDFSHEVGCWETQELKGLRFFSSLDSFREENTNHVALAIGQTDLQAVNMEHYGGHSRGSYLTVFDTDLIPPVLVRWACSILLSSFESELSKIRDSKVFHSTKTKPKQLLKELQKAMVNSVDIATLSPELAKFSKSRLFERETCKFVHKKLRDGDQPNELIKNLAQNITYKSGQLQLIDRSVKDLLIQQGNLVSAVENINLQSQMGCLTWAILILTIITALLTGLSLYHTPPKALENFSIQLLGK